MKPCPIAPFYGLMWWLSSDRRQFAAAADTSPGCRLPHPPPIAPREPRGAGLLCGAAHAGADQAPCQECRPGPRRERADSRRPQTPVSSSSAPSVAICAWITRRSAARPISRDEAACNPGSIFLTPSTLALAEGFLEVKSLGPVAAKRLASPLPRKRSSQPVKWLYEAPAARNIPAPSTMREVRRAAPSARCSRSWWNCRSRRRRRRKTQTQTSSRSTCFAPPDWHVPTYERKRVAQWVARYVSCAPCASGSS